MFKKNQVFALLAAILLLVIVFVPSLAFAQDGDDAPPVETTIPDVVVIQPDTGEVTEVPTDGGGTVIIQPESDGFDSSEFQFIVIAVLITLVALASLFTYVLHSQQQKLAESIPPSVIEVWKMVTVAGLQAGRQIAERTPTTADDKLLDILEDRVRGGMRDNLP